MGDLCVLTTGATVAVAFGLAGGFLFCGVFALLGDSSDSEEYTDGLGFGGCLSLLLFSKGGTDAVSALVLTWRVTGNGGFFLVLSVSDAFWLLAELLEFSESDELDSLPELDELLDEEPELLVDVDSELVVYKKKTSRCKQCLGTYNLDKRFFSQYEKLKNQYKITSHCMQCFDTHFR